jgi:5-carboxymethyl-2-hydroxymuconate isomerase
MKFASYSHNGRESFGIVRGSGIFDLPFPLGHRAEKLADIFGSDLTVRASTLPADAAPDFALSDVSLLPPIPKPGKIVCVGINYRSRPGEHDRGAPEFPSLFFRHVGAQVGHLSPLVRPRESDQFDYEGEIAVVIGRPGRRILESSALDHVAGYSCFNDGSVRDWMKHGAYNVTAGKNFERSGAFGPFLATPDEVGDARDIAVRTRVNGTVVQEDSSANMIFPIARLISYISTFMRLDAGDVIATGTPAGAGARHTPPRWLKAGDLVEVEVGGVGVLSNPVIDDEPDPNKEAL